MVSSRSLSRSEFEAPQGRTDAVLAELGDVHPVDGHREVFGFEPRAVAGRARLLHHQALDLLLDPFGLGLAIAPLQVVDHTLVAGLEAPRMPAVRRVAHAHRLVLGEPVEDEPALLGVEVLPGDVERNLEAPADGLEHLHHPVLRGAARPSRECAFIDAQCGVGDHRIGVDLETHAESGARRACAVRVVEREVARCRFLHRDPAVHAREFLGEEHLLHATFGVRRDQQDEPVAQLRRLFERLMESRTKLRPDDDAVDDDLDVVLELLVERNWLRQVVKLAVHAHANVAEALGLVEDVAMLALSSLHHRGRDEQPGSLGEEQHLVGDLLDRLLADLATAVGTVRMADARVHEAQIVVDLGHGADRRPRVLARPLLVDGDRRAQPLDVIDVGLLHLAEKLTRVCAQRLDVATLAFRIDGVERERRLATPRQPGDHDELVARQRQVDVLEVVLARTADDDLIVGH